MYKKRIIIVFVIVLVFMVFFPYLKAEYLTHRYGEEFEGLEIQTKMLKQSRYYKVLSYSNDRAEVFYISDTGDIISFEKVNDHWNIADWKTIWAKSGSADSFYWPYYR